MTTPPPSRGFLNFVEALGNKLPDPTILFLWCALGVMALSAVAAATGWTVQPRRLQPVVTTTTDAAGNTVTSPVLDSAGKPTLEMVDAGAPITARSLLSADGLYWAISSMVDNFVRFPPLGVVLVGMLGIGLAERSGFIGAALKALMLIVPPRLLTPTVVFLGIMSSLGTDAGYVVLPPVAAALYKAAGRSPIAGIAAVFAGIGAGFNANLLITSLDPLLAGFTQPAAQTIDPAYTVSPACNWWFMIASTVLITLVGWGASSLFVERRLHARPADDGGPSPLAAGELAAQRLTPVETRALIAGTISVLVATAVFLAFTLIPGAPFDDGRGRLSDAVRGLGLGDHFDRWVESIVPMLFILFIIPGMVYGWVSGTVRGGKDFTKALTDTMAYMAPIIVLAFFAAQFIEYFKFSNLDKMLAHTGGQALATSGLSPLALVIAFIFLTMFFNMLIGSMSAKYAMFAPIFVPMLMLVGISPELTQAAYRIGDSTTNVITPLNSYLIIILVVIQKHAPRAGMGTLISMMMPFTICFTVAWIALILLWMLMGWPLGPGDDGPLWYTPAAPVVN